MNKKFVQIIAAIVAAVWVFHNPSGAAALIHNIIHAVTAFADAL